MLVTMAEVNMPLPYTSMSKAIAAGTTKQMTHPINGPLPDRISPATGVLFPGLMAAILAAVWFAAPVWMLRVVLLGIVGLPALHSLIRARHFRSEDLVLLLHGQGNGLALPLTQATVYGGVSAWMTYRYLSWPDRGVGWVDLPPSVQLPRA